MPRFEKVDDMITKFRQNREKDIGTMQIKSRKRSIRFEGVSFLYPDVPKNVFDKIDLNLGPSEFVVLVGLSGSGKSTLIDLLTRIQSPSSGTIFLNGIDIQQYKISQYRSLFSFVGQEPALFDGTLHYNLTVKQPDVSRKQREEIIESLNLSSLVSGMDLGFNTNVGERGLKLSGGQKQRISLASAFLKTSDFMIFDEPTSALDNENEKAVVELISAEIKDKGKTAIVITHNWEVAKFADRMLKLEKGRLVYDGPPEISHFYNDDKM